MGNAEPDVPHFVRVVRALARLRGAALPLTALTTTVVAGVYCGEMGVAVGPPETPHCTTDSDCLYAPICFKTVCFAQGGEQCKGDADCGIGNVCFADGSGFGVGGCLYGGASCKTDADCSPSPHGALVCEPSAGICVPPGGPCASDADCGGGERCDTTMAACVTASGPLGVGVMPDGGS